MNLSQSNRTDKTAQSVRTAGINDPARAIGG